MQRMWQRGPDGEIVRSRRTVAEGVSPEAEGAAGAPRGRAKLGLAVRLGFRDTYDHLGMVLLISAGFVVAATLAVLGGQLLGLVLFGGLPGYLPALLSVLLAGMAWALVAGPLAGGIFHYCRNAANRQEPEIFDLSWGFRRAMGRSVALAFLQFLIAVLLVSNCYFYLSQRQAVLVVFGATFGYGLLFWLMMCLYQWPLMAEQEIRTRAVIRKSALLVLDNSFYTAGLALLVLALSAVLWMTMIGGALLWAGSLAMIATQATRELLRKYGALPPDPTLDPIAGETHELGGHGWHE
jgi:uncharacterized membrane protein YesL